MKCTEVTFANIIRAMRYQWKTFACCVVGFAALGIVSGLIWADDLAASPRCGGTVEGLLIPDFSIMYSCDAADYISYSNQLRESYIRARTCLLLLQREPTLDFAQRAALHSFEVRCTEFEKTDLQPIWKALSATPYDMAENDGSYEQDLAMALNQACRELGKLIVELKNTVCEIAESNHLDILVFYDKTADIYYLDPLNLKEEHVAESGKKLVVIHIPEYRSTEETFLILIIFCLLTGACTGGFFSICRQCEVEKRSHCNSNKTHC